MWVHWGKNARSTMDLNANHWTWYPIVPCDSVYIYVQVVAAYKQKNQYRGVKAMHLDERTLASH